MQLKAGLRLTPRPPLDHLERGSRAVTGMKRRPRLGGGLGSLLLGLVLLLAQPGGVMAGGQGPAQPLARWRTFLAGNRRGEPGI